MSGKNKSNKDVRDSRPVARNDEARTKGKARLVVSESDFMSDENPLVMILIQYACILIDVINNSIMWEVKHNSRVGEGRSKLGGTMNAEINRQKRNRDDSDYESLEGMW